VIWEEAPFTLYYGKDILGIIGIKEGFMSKGLIIFVAIGTLLAYILVGFVGDLEDEDDNLLTEEKLIRKQDRAYYETDVVGQTILIFKEGMPMAKKIGVWKRSPLHQEFLELSPNFEEMRHFAKDRIIDKAFRKRLIQVANDTEDAYFSGKITQGEIKNELDTFQ